MIDYDKILKEWESKLPSNTIWRSKASYNEKSIKRLMRITFLAGLKEAQDILEGSLIMGKPGHYALGSLMGTISAIKLINNIEEEAEDE